MSISASQWGSPTASKRALLIHGMTMSSNSWEGIAHLLVAEGFFVVAPNLLGHAWRRGAESYRVSAFAEDLRPYFAMDTSYDVIIGHSFGGPVALSLLSFLPNTKKTTVILLDPTLELTEEKATMLKNMFLGWITNIKTPEEHMAENPAWLRRDCVFRTLGITMCDHNLVEVFLVMFQVLEWEALLTGSAFCIEQQNTPWSSSGLFKNIPPNVTVTVLASDPECGATCLLEHVPRGVERLSARVVTGASHWIQYERPDAVMDAIPPPKAKIVG
ncbi:Alpha/Beta hydrolase protein [Suillus ampliporus]|nr:Alpha/Beta hydrolase protein [Suillus ampliporus]